MLKKRLLVVSAVMAALLFLGEVKGHREAVDEEELASKVVEEAENVDARDEPFIENLKVGPIGPEVYTGPKDFNYCMSRRYFNSYRLYQIHF